MNGGLAHTRARAVSLAAFAVGTTLVASGCQFGAAADIRGESPWPIAPTHADIRCGAAGQVYPPEATEGEKVYVSLGDSYAAGEGEPLKITDDCGETHRRFITGTDVKGNRCHRSLHAYPVRLWHTLEERDSAWSLDFRACSGATSKNFQDDEHGNPPQWPVSRLDSREWHTARNADLVTITMAGNDLHFADIVGDCLINAALLPIERLRPNVGGCEEKWQPKIDEVLETTLREELVRAYESVQVNLNDEGRLLVAGYPEPFPVEPPLVCNPSAGLSPWMTRSMMTWLNDVAKQANQVIQDAAHEAGASYVDVSDVLQNGNHTACNPDGSERWINLTIKNPDYHFSWHPKWQFHQVEADRMLACYLDPQGAPYCDVSDPDPTLSEPYEESWPITIGELPVDGPSINEPYIKYAFNNMGCSKEDGGPGLGVLLNDAVFGDATNDGIEDALIALECNPSTSGWPETVLVLDGANGRRGAPIAGVLIDGTQTPTRLDATDFAINNGTITVSGHDYAKGGPEPTMTFLRTYAWNGNEFIDESVDQDPTAPRDRTCPAAAVQVIGGSAVPVDRFETDSSSVTICADAAGSLYYYGATSAGEIVLHAQDLGGATYQAVNIADGSTYIYTISPSELVITQDGALLLRQPVVG